MKVIVPEIVLETKEDCDFWSDEILRAKDILPNKSKEG
jgi:hypothetical protein